MSTILFAIDSHAQEVLVSASAKGSKEILFKERISMQEHELLYQAVTTLTLIASAEVLDVRLYKAMDKVCQLIYDAYCQLR